MSLPSEIYPVDWPELAFAIKDACGWRCQQCDKPCRRPGQKFINHDDTLTIAHWDNEYLTPAVFVVAICWPCHRAHDASFGGAARRRWGHIRRQRAGQLELIRPRLIYSHSDLTHDDLAEMGAAWPGLDELFAEVQTL